MFRFARLALIVGLVYTAGSLGFAIPIYYELGL